MKKNPNSANVRSRTWLLGYGIVEGKGWFKTAHFCFLFAGWPIIASPCFFSRLFNNKVLWTDMFVEIGWSRHWLPLRSCRQRSQRCLIHMTWTRSALGSRQGLPTTGVVVSGGSGGNKSRLVRKWTAVTCFNLKKGTDGCTTYISIICCICRVFVLLLLSFMGAESSTGASLLQDRVKP